MSVVAKMSCKVVQSTDASSSRVKLSAVYDPDPNSENGKFFAATPAGEVDMHIVRSSVAEYFVEGAEYLVRFERVS